MLLLDDLHDECEAIPASSLEHSINRKRIPDTDKHILLDHILSIRLRRVSQVHNGMGELDSTVCNGTSQPNLAPPRQEPSSVQKDQVVLHEK